IQGVRVGAKCTVMVYRPTGSGKIHTMFGCARQPGIVYRALRDILEGGIGSEGDSTEDDAGLFVHVTVLEIYNEEVYDLLVGSEAATKGNAPRISNWWFSVRYSESKLNQVLTGHLQRPRYEAQGQPQQAQKDQETASRDKVVQGVDQVDVVAYRRACFGPGELQQA
ncbi:hypothetical protein ACJX0J_041589, partial [Zea mays]